MGALFFCVRYVLHSRIETAVRCGTVAFCLLCIIIVVDSLFFGEGQ